MPPKKAPTPSPSPWRKHALIIGAIWALILIAYSNSFQAGLIFDSRHAVLDDPRVHDATPRSLRAIWSGGYWFDNTSPDLYRPLTTLSYLVNYAVLGSAERPAGYHWLNFFLHALNAALVYALGLTLFADRWRAAALAALWAAHPIVTESVTNIVGRADLLATFAVLAGLLCHVKFGRRPVGIVTVGLASAVGIFAKESAVVLIALMVVWDLAFRRDRIRDSIPCYAAALLPVAIFLYRRSQVMSSLPLNPTTFLNNPLLGAGFWSARLGAIGVIGRYVGLLLWPQSLSCDYSYNQIPVFDGWTVLGIVACLALLAATALAYRHNRPVFFLLVLFFIALAPVANIAILIGTIMAERFLYLPAVGFVGCVIWVLYEKAGRRANWIVAVLGVALIARTYARNQDWQNARTLWTGAVGAAPGSYKAHYNLSRELFADPAGLDLAIAEGERSVAILKPLPIGKDEDAYPYLNLAIYYRAKGDAAGAAWYRKSVDALLHAAAVDRARADMLIRINQSAGRRLADIGTVQIYQLLAESYLRLDQPRSAIEPLEHAAALSPDPAVFQLTAEAYTALHDRAAAAIALMEGLVLRPDQQKLVSELVHVYRDEPGCALANGGLNLACPLVHDHLCTAANRVRDLLLRRGQSADADRIHTTAIQTFACPQ